MLFCDLGGEKLDSHMGVGGELGWMLLSHVESEQLVVGGGCCAGSWLSRFWGNEPSRCGTEESIVQELDRLVRLP